LKPAFVLSSQSIQVQSVLRRECLDSYGVLFVVVFSAQRDQVRRIASRPARLRVRRIDDADTLHDHHPKLTEADNATF
jgi:hypothetical protein